MRAFWLAIGTVILGASALLHASVGDAWSAAFLGFMTGVWFTFFVDTVWP